MFRPRAFFALVPSILVGVGLTSACHNDPESAPPFPENGDGAAYDSSFLSSSSSSSSGNSSSGDPADTSVPLTSQCSTPPVASTPMTCDWLGSTSNCWANALMEVKTCGLMASGTLSTDRSTCTGNGDTAKFSPPYPAAPLAASTLFTYAFSSADSGGASCYSILTNTPPTDTPITPTGGLSITTPKGCVSLTYENSTYTVTCEDGSAHQGDAATLNDTCATPAWDFDSTATYYAIELEWGANSFGEDENLVPVTCNSP